MQSSAPTSIPFISIKLVLTDIIAPPKDELDDFLKLFRTKTLKAGEYFVHAGEQSTELAFINAGLLRFFYQTEDGKEINKSFSTENQFAAAYSAFLTAMPSRFNIQALEDSQILIANLQSVVTLFEKHQCWGKLGRILAEQLYIKKEMREAEFLLDDAQTRYHSFQKHYPDLEDRLPQYHVASYLGITPVMLSRIRNR